MMIEFFGIIRVLAFLMTWTCAKCISNSAFEMRSKSQATVVSERLRNWLKESASNEDLFGFTDAPPGYESLSANEEVKMPLVEITSKFKSFHRWKDIF